MNHAELRAAEAGGGIRPFQIAIPQAEVEDLRNRLDATRWPTDLNGTGWERGVPGPYLRDLVSCWRHSYDWREREARLNQLPQGMTVIDGQPIHFVHCRSPHADALPLLLLHGWPGSFVEFSRMIGPLTDPPAHGGRAADSFDVVVPSLPGFGFSTPVRDLGWTTGRAGRALAVLMERLGYRRYGVHGSDVGAGVAGALGAAAGSSAAGMHFASDPPTAVSFASFTGDPAGRPGLSANDRDYVEELKQKGVDGGAYLQLQSTRPQTLGYALTDSPVAQLAWVVEKFHEWTDRNSKLPQDAVDIDQLLDNASLYWFSRSGASAAHFLYESMRAQEWDDPGGIPTGFAIFGAHAIVRKLLNADGRISHWSEFPVGGHFPAMEVPQLLTTDLQDFFRSLR